MAGIGDRHLDNILLLPSGQLMHVDFGFSFGKDPKHAYLRSQMRFTREMYEALGGEEGEWRDGCCLLITIIMTS
jgi:phosphatidylinositol 3-kinase